MVSHPTNTYFASEVAYAERQIEASEAQVLRLEGEIRIERARITDARARIAEIMELGVAIPTTPE